MEKELNIAAILEKNPNVKVWSDTFGELRFDFISNTHNDFPIAMTAKNGNDIRLTKDGRYYNDVDGALPCIVPSKEMRSWEKFAWKKGDVLCGYLGNLCIFDKWANDQYTEFYGRYPSPTYSKDGDKFDTESWSSGVEGIVKITFIKNIEEHYGGKLNLETLEIEQPKQEFKDGDIVSTEDNREIFIFKRLHSNTFDYYAALLYGDIICYDCFSVDMKLRPATDSEKQQLFDALAKEGKVWNSDTKQVGDLPKKCEFEAFDKVLVRDLEGEEWRPAFFWKEHPNDSEFVIIGGTIYSKCIPYNEETAHLLGTTDDWKGGK